MYVHGAVTHTWYQECCHQSAVASTFQKYSTSLDATSAGIHLQAYRVMYMRNSALDGAHRQHHAELGFEVAAAVQNCLTRLG